MCPDTKLSPVHVLFVNAEPFHALLDDPAVNVTSRLLITIVIVAVSVLLVSLSVAVTVTLYVPAAVLAVNEIVLFVLLIVAPVGALLNV